jgi:hypothetical protein
MHGLESLIIDRACDASVSWDVAKSEFVCDPAESGNRAWRRWQYNVHSKPGPCQGPWTYRVQSTY